MNTLKNILITILRDKITSQTEFRSAADKLTCILASEAANYLETETVSVQTAFGTTKGEKFKNNIVLVPILRSGLAFLPSCLFYFQDASVGIIGLKRDEVTALPKLYYKNLPKSNRMIKSFCLIQCLQREEALQLL